VLQHFVFRYWTYYRDPDHIANFIQPLIQDLIDVFLSNDRVVFFSAHDINLFGLLSVLGSARLTTGPLSSSFSHENLYSIWPEYGVYTETLVAKCLLLLNE
jgi:hypothetical protein